MDIAGALGNRRFRSLLLAVAGVPICLMYIWQTLIVPIVFGSDASTDFVTDNIAGARLLAVGRDPLGQCQTPECFVHVYPGGPYPPFVSWALQPLIPFARPTLNTIGLLACQVAFALALGILLSRLHTRDWQFRVLLALLALAWWPVANDLEERQLHLIVLLLVVLWWAAWIEGRAVIAGVALGVSCAIKIVTAPLLALALPRARWVALAVGLGTWAGLWALAPRFLPEYVFRVMPALADGNGFARNEAPAAVMTRAFDPVAFWGQRHGPAPAAVALTMVVVLLVPLFVLADRAVAGRDVRAGVIAAFVWLVLGPGEVAFLNATNSGQWPFPVLAGWADLGSAAMLALWLALLTQRWRPPRWEIRA